MNLNKSEGSIVLLLGYKPSPDEYPFPRYS